ncbi:hypothetical protein J7T55_011187 [Diaporthe amygdali]|uniref:uncharacterized protein n=1 Tax=Phomopsis amygdali TaxID=1214568 RepID=UPI0022FF31F2|nr:uncharacterized protein J7T55_011187 [Diaporthe amygdali]KAJ0108698.1 hypothetical protein J7T55_011187 [Diaporthe amygdali]
MKLQKKPHVLDVQGVRRIVHLYGSTAMFANELESQGFEPEVGGPITAEKAFALLQQYPQPFHSKQLPFRLDLGWDIKETLHDTHEEDSDTENLPASRAQELFTTPHRANKMPPPKTSTGKRRAVDKDSPSNELHESIDTPDDVLAVHSITVFAKETCRAEKELGFLYELHPDAAFLKTCAEAVKVLPEQIKVVDGIIERYSNKPSQQSSLSFLDRVKNTLPGATSPKNRDCFIVDQPNPFSTPQNNPYAFSVASPRIDRGSPSQPVSPYAPRPEHRVTQTQETNAEFYKDLAQDLAKLAEPNSISHYGEPKRVTVEGSGKITLFLNDSRIGDLATTSLNFWAGVLQMQDIKTRFGFQTKEDGTLQREIPDQAFQVAASRYAALDFSTVSRKLGRTVAFYRREPISKRGKLTSRDVQKDLAKLTDDDLSMIMGFHPDQSPLGNASGIRLIEL